MKSLRGLRGFSFCLWVVGPDFGGFAGGDGRVVAAPDDDVAKQVALADDDPGSCMPLDFTPRLVETDWLVGHFKPTAMMDLSDGLAKDLPRLAAASGCGYRIVESSLPLTPGCTPAQALGDGEDFEILFAINAGRVPELLAAWPAAFSSLTCIGALTDLHTSDSLSGGWDHFSRA